MADEPKETDNPDRLRPLRLLGDADVRLTYADAVWVGYSADDMTLSFFQTKRAIDSPPLPEPLDAVCVVRLALPLRMMKHLRDVLTDIIPRFEAAQKELLGGKKD